MDTLEDVMAAVDAGHTVCWKHDNYEVQVWGVAEGAHPNTAYVVACVSNGNGVGLFYADGIRSDHDPADFYIKSRWAPGDRVELRLDKLRGTNSGTLATVVRMLRSDEADIEVGPMYEVTLRVFADEIKEPD